MSRERKGRKLGPRMTCIAGEESQNDGNPQTSRRLGGVRKLVQLEIAILLEASQALLVAVITANQAGLLSRRTLRTPQTSTQHSTHPVPDGFNPQPHSVDPYRAVPCPISQLSSRSTDLLLFLLSLRIFAPQLADVRSVRFLLHLRRTDPILSWSRVDPQRPRCPHTPA